MGEVDWELIRSFAVYAKRDGRWEAVMYALLNLHERLRAVEREAAAAKAVAAKDERDTLAAWMRGQAVVAAATVVPTATVADRIRNAMLAGEASEREAIVAWLHEHADRTAAFAAAGTADHTRFAACAAAINAAADMISEHEHCWAKLVTAGEVAASGPAVEDVPACASAAQAAASERAARACEYDRANLDMRKQPHEVERAGVLATPTCAADAHAAADAYDAAAKTAATAAEAELHSLREQLAGYQRGAAFAREHYATATIEQARDFCAELNGEAVRMASDYAQLGGRHADLSDSLPGRLRTAVEAERATIVAWLRSQAGNRYELCGVHADGYGRAANAIEHGDHLKESR